MGYQINYNGGEIRKEEVKTDFVKLSGKKLPLLVIGLTLLAACVVGRQRWERILIPGDKEITKTAFSNMITDIRTGEPVSDAIAAFCKEIIDYAEIQ